VTSIDLNFESAMSKGSGTIFVTDGAVQTVIDRVTGEPKLRVVGGTFSKQITLDKVSIEGTHVKFDAAGLPPGASINLYMAAGTLLSGGKPAGAITVPGSAAFTTPAADPSLSATIALDGASLKSGEEITVTITFSKAVASLSPASLAAGNAGIKDLASADGGTTWTATLSGLDAVNAPSNVLRLNMDTVVAADGSRGAGSVDSSSYLVDTLVAAYVDDAIQMFDDNGPDDMDGITNGDAMGLGGLLRGDLKAGESFELVINGAVVDPAKIEMYAAYEPGTHYWYYTGADDEHFALGENTVLVRVVGPDGHSSQTVGKTILVEQDTPGIVSQPTGTVDAGQSISIGFDEAMYLDDNVESVQKIELVDGFGNTSWIVMDDSMLSPDRKTLTIDPASHNLATGNDYDLYLPDGLTDLAGNEYDGLPISFRTGGAFQDKAPPRLVQMYIVNGGGSYNAGDVLEFRLRYTEKVNLDAGTEPVLYLDGGMTADYVGLANGGTEMVFKYTIKPGDNEESLDVDHSWTLYGHVRDDHGNVFQQAHVEYDGLSDADGYGAMVSVDTAVEQPGAPQLHADSEANSPGAGTTLDSRPRLTGSGAEAWATISIYEGAVKIGSAIADENGGWDSMLTASLAPGVHQITVSQEDRAGNVSGLSAAFALTVVATAPASLAAPVLDSANDTGVSSSDRLTAADQPTIGGTAPANLTLKLKHNGAEIATVTTDASGHWNHTLPSLAEGVHDFTLQYGDTGPVSPALSITVDGSNPVVGPEWNELLEHFDPGHDLVITFSEAIHIGAAEGDADMLRLIDEDGVVQTIAVGAANLSADKRTLRISSADHDLQPLTNYRVQLPATLTDLAGNAMGEYQIHLRTGNEAVPSAVRAVVDGDGSYRAGETITFRIRFNEQVEKVGDSGLSLGLGNDARAVFTGMAGIDNSAALFSYTVASGHDFANLRITDTSELAGRFADLSGNLLDGAHIALADLYDGSGYGTRIDIDTMAPTAPAAPSLHADSNSGNGADLLTNDRTPLLTGNAEGGAKVEIYEGDTLLGYGYADAGGSWSVGVDAAHALLDGTHALTVRQVDRAGNQSPASAPLTVTVDATVAALDAPRLADGHDTGASATDKLTRETRPILEGGGAEAGAGVKLLWGDTLVGFGHADGNGNWRIGLFDEIGELEDGHYAFTVRQEDNAGNLSAPSAALEFTVDRTPPVKLAAPDLAAASDSGRLNNDNITNDSTPTFSGSGAPVNRTVALIVDSIEVGRVTTDMLGNWSITSTALSDGVHQVQVRHVDEAGNQSLDSDPTSVTIDTARPELTSFYNNRTLKQFELGFNEEVVFYPDGIFNLLRHDSVRRSYHGHDDSNWNLVTGSDGKSTLILEIGMNGTFNLSMHSEDAIQDVAGNVAKIVGMPAWEPDQTI